MKEGLPSIMGLKPDPIIDCPTIDFMKCDAYKIDPCPWCTANDLKDGGT